jgi:site-specific recombinase XerD
VPKQFKLPTVLTIPEVDQLINAIRKPALKCSFWTVHSQGLRLEEMLHLQVSDIDAARMLVHMRRRKGHKDRQAATAERPVAKKTVQDCIAIYLHLTTVGEEIAVAKINALMTDRQVGDHV